MSRFFGHRAISGHFFLIKFQASIEEMDAKCNAEGLSGNGAPSDVPEEMLAELQREIARNQEAVRLVKERELQALSAKLRYVQVCHR